MPERRQVLLGLAGDAARVAGVELLGHRVVDVADHDQRLVLGERVEERGGLVRHQQHVGGLDLLEAADRGAVEAQALVDRVASKAAAGKEVCCHIPGRSVKRRSMISTPWSLTAFMTSAADVHPSIMG